MAFRATAERIYFRSLSDKSPDMPFGGPVFVLSADPLRLNRTRFAGRLRSFIYDNYRQSKNGHAQKRGHRSPHRVRVLQRDGCNRYETRQTSDAAHRQDQAGYLLPHAQSVRHNDTVHGGDVEFEVTRVMQACGHRRDGSDGRLPAIQKRS